jgi:hypothetical protein
MKTRSTTSRGLEIVIRPESIRTFFTAKRRRFHAFARTDYLPLFART